MALTPSFEREVRKALVDLKALGEKVDTEQNERIEALEKRMAKIERSMRAAFPKPDKGKKRDESPMPEGTKFDVRIPK